MLLFMKRTLFVLTSFAIILLVLYYNNQTSFLPKGISVPFENIFIQMNKTKPSDSHFLLTSNSTTSKSTIKHIQSPFPSITAEKAKCEPFFTDFKQYQVEIDNETYPKSVPIYYNKSINFECLNANSRRPLILFWNKFWDSEYTNNESRFKVNGCPVTNCETTVDRNRWNDSNLVVVHQAISLSDVSKYRPDSLRTVFLYLESPVSSWLDLTQYDSFFNLTATYRHDSDFPHYYEELFGNWKKNPDFNRAYDFHGQKDKFAVALIGNCNDNCRRLELIEQLRKYVPIDVVGNNREGFCSNKTCPAVFKNGTKGDCRAILAEEYKFFLTFENSVCEDYITEKFFRTLQYNTIPVVRGGGNYSKFVPKSGFLDTKDFRTVKELADRMLFLAGNKAAYNAYFKWKEHVVFDQPVLFNPICHMCIQLNLEQFLGVKKSVIRNLGEYMSKRNNCMTLKELKNSTDYYPVF